MDSGKEKRKMASLEHIFAGKAGINSLKDALSNYLSKKAARNLAVYQASASKGNAICEFFRFPPLTVDQDGDGAPTGSTGDENLLYCDESVWRYHILGTQTIVAPVWSVGVAATGVGGGLNIGMDQTNDDGVEISLGTNPRSPFVCAAGTTAAYIEVVYTVADVTGAGDMAVGWRKAEAFQADLDDYDEMACVNMQGGVWNLETILNNGATTTTDTTLADMTDAQQATVRVEVDSAGAVTYKIGAGTPSNAGPSASTPTVTAAFSFDTNEFLIPFIYFLHDSDVAGDVIIQKIEVGYL
jgi:hypothetical protein